MFNRQRRIVVVGLLMSFSLGAQEAAKVFSDLEVSGALKDSKPTIVQNSYKTSFGGAVTYGAEKEGHGAALTAVMGPNVSRFKKFVNGLDGAGTTKRKRFLEKFMDGMFNGDFQVEDVKDVNGRSMNINDSKFRGLNYYGMSSSLLYSKFNEWLELTHDNPFSYIKPEIRKLIYGQRVKVKDAEGKIVKDSSGKAKTEFVSLIEGQPESDKLIGGDYKNWVALFGDAQKYIGGAVPSVDRFFEILSSGWEINFKVMDSYGDFEKMIDWFKKAMAYAEEGDDASVREVLFEAPGHQRIVYPEMKLAPAERDEMRAKISEMYRNFQAYIVLRGIAGNTGIIASNWKKIISDSEMANLDSWKGVVRLEGDRWGKHVSLEGSGKTQGIEVRAGTKDAEVQRHIEKVLTARVATNDWDNVQPIYTWGLVPKGLYNLKKWGPLSIGAISKLSARFEVSASEVEAFIKAYQNAEMKSGNSVDIVYLAPLWKWEDAPYLGAEKKKLVKNLSRDLIKHTAAHSELSAKELDENLQDWAKVTNIQENIAEYLRPTQKIKKSQAPQDFPVAEDAAFDVNNIDLGIEYTAHYPMRDSVISTKKLSDGKFHWKDTNLGLTVADRHRIIKNLAKTLASNLGGHLEEEEEEPVLPGQAHGHGISIAYKLVDSLGRGWRVEWDGIQREYDEKGKIVPGSLSRGHIELVTPKFKPTMTDINAVFEAFAKNSTVPHAEVGGGHVNIDLNPFNGNPKEMGRFLSIFHKYRGVIAMMFQNISRMRTSEPATVSAELHEKLKDFKGSETELKKLLYNEKYFNSRVGRKTRYQQLDVTSYFQDVIPENFIQDDFDVNSPTEPWRQQFRVDPKVRKMEMRMMNAPRDPLESAMQMKLARALLNKAFNGVAPITGSVQEVNFDKYLQNPAVAFADLKKMTEELGLSFEEYKSYMGRGISEYELSQRSKYYRSIEEKLQDNIVVSDWGLAQEPRSMAEGVSYKGRAWRLPNGTTRSPYLPEVKAFMEKRVLGVKEAQRERKRYVNTRKKNDEKVSCFRRSVPDLGLPEVNKLREEMDKVFAPRS